MEEKAPGEEPSRGREAQEEPGRGQNTASQYLPVPRFSGSEHGVPPLGTTHGTLALAVKTSPLKIIAKGILD